MMKLVGRCIVQTSRPSSNVGPQPPGWVHPKCGIGLRRWVIGTRCLVIFLLLMWI